MAEIFINYYHKEPKRATGIARALERRGHVVLLLKPGEQWPLVVPKRLYECDAVVALLTRRSIGDEWTTLERGMAVGIQLLHRRGTIIPVLLQRQIRLPETLRSGYFAVDGADLDDQHIADQIDATISRHAPTPAIFVSHSYVDKELAAALRTVLDEAFTVATTDVRVTSLVGGKLGVGAPVPEALRHGVEEARVVMGILTRDSIQSTYVLFELGASRGLQKPTYPLLAGGITSDDLPGPLREREAIDLAQAPDCYRLIDQLHRDTYLSRKEGEGVRGRIEEAIQSLTRAAKVKTRRSGLGR